MSNGAKIEERISNFEGWADWCAWTIVFGLALEIILALEIPNLPLNLKWGTVAADTAIMLGVAGEILFTRKARTLADALQRELNERVATAERETERLRSQLSQRMLDGPTFVEWLKDKPSVGVRRLCMRRTTQKLDMLADQFKRFLGAAGWEVIMVGIIPPSVEPWTHLPSAVSVGGQSAGVAIVTPVDVIGFDGDAPEDALFKATYAALTLRDVSMSNNADVPAGTLRIVISPKVVNQNSWAGKKGSGIRDRLLDLQGDRQPEWMSQSTTVSGRDGAYGHSTDPLAHAN